MDSTVIVYDGKSYSRGEAQYLSTIAGVSDRET
jgi:hypothetical protein